MDFSPLSESMSSLLLAQAREKIFYGIVLNSGADLITQKEKFSTIVGFIKQK